MKLTKEILEEMEAVDIREVDINELTDLRDIVIDTKKSVTAKLASFAEQTNNIYVNRFGDYIVKVRFQKEGPTLDDRVGEYLKRLTEVHI
ncbi:MAG: hypothetical protein K2P64_08575 [Lachnospiraceae bacterium]|nr:hypothetical protein [Lachnospiraceae bacterium]